MAVIYDFANIGQFTEKTMEIVGIRIQNKDIYIKAPYGELFAANSRNTAPVGNNFIILKNATILLNDIGGETLISYGDAKTAKRPPRRAISRWQSEMTARISVRPAPPPLGQS